MLKSFLATLFVSFLCTFSAFGQETSNVLGKSDSAESPASAQTTDDDDNRRFQARFHFTNIGNGKNNLAFNDRNRPGFGVGFGYDVAKFGNGKYVATIEAEMNYSPKNASNIRVVNLGNNTTTVDSRTNGRILQGLYGIKLGRKFDKFGVFGKAKAGFVQYTNGKQGSVTSTGINFDTSTNFAGDLGGVIEFYPTKRIFTRLDFGDTIVRIGKQSVNTTVATPSGFVIRNVNFATRTQHNFQFSAGIGFRF